jgi:GDP-mannose 6-dehydrogenase
MDNSKQTVVVLGLGYVGCVTAACLAELGHSVIGVDRDGSKVKNITEGRAPFYEPGLETLVENGVRSGNLRATTSAADPLREADIVMACVGTPSERNGNLGLDQLKRAVEEIAASLAGRSKPLTLAIRSTVFPGTCEEVVIPAFAKFPQVSVVSNPEFLREGSAVKDFREPSLVVVGGSDSAAVRKVAALYDALGVEPRLVSLRTAEMIKYACNAFHAVKISFANEVGALSAKLSIDAREVMTTLCYDTRLNISAAYLKPGFAFGGSCLPKDLRALTYRSARLDVKLPFLESVLPANQAHLNRAIQEVLDLPGERIGMIGLAFKENTDDLRESPVVTLLEQLIGKGRSVRVYDPHISLDSIYGSNRDFILTAIPHIGKLLESKIQTVLEWADHVVLAQPPSGEMAQAIRDSGRPVLDLVGSGLFGGTKPVSH